MTSARGRLHASSSSSLWQGRGRSKALPPTQSLCLTYLPPSLSLPTTLTRISLSLGPGSLRSNLEAKMRALGAAGVCLLWALLVAMAPGGASELPTLIQEPVKSESALLKPKVMIAIVARNAAHSLPHYLGCIEKLEYPKERIAIW